MGTYSSDDFESGTRAALSGGTTMVVDFVLPGQGQGLMDAAQMWHNKSGRANCDYSYHMAVTWWGEKVFDGIADSIKAGMTSFKHFMAYKGALMVNDDEMYQSFKRVLGSWAASRWSMPRTAMWWRKSDGEASGRGEHRAGSACLFAAPAGGGRGDQPRDRDRRHGGGAALCGCIPAARRRMRRSGGRGSRASGSGASR